MKYLENYIKVKNGDIICGLTKELNVFCVLEYFNSHDDNVIVLTSSLYEANMFYDSLCTYTKDVCLFPMDDFLTSVAIAISPDLKIKRLETLDEIGNGKKIIVTNLTGFLRFLPNKKVEEKIKFSLKKGIDINRENFLNLLEKFGYNRDSVVTATGEYAVRGYIIDLFLVGEEHPIRIEFFGNTIESIRYFNENSQLSINEVDNIICRPFEEIETDEKSSLFDYLDNPMVFKVNSDQLNASYEKLIEDMFEYRTSIGETQEKKYMFEMNDIQIKKEVILDNFKNAKATAVYDCREIYNFDSDLKD